MNPKVKALMDAYAAAFDQLDADKQAELFSESFISAGPKGTITQSREEFRQSAVKAGDFYRKAGKTSASILSLDEHVISPDYSLVKVHWGVSFKKNGDKPVEFDVSYLVQLTGPEPKILAFITHQDEDSAMQELA